MFRKIYLRKSLKLFLILSIIISNINDKNNNSLNIGNWKLNKYQYLAPTNTVSLDFSEKSLGTIITFKKGNKLETSKIEMGKKYL